MGGYGSGWQGSKKMTVEECLKISTAKLQHDGSIKSSCVWAGILTWRNTVTGEKISRISFNSNVDTMDGWSNFQHTSVRTGIASDYPVRLVSTPLPWGGRRWWFICPLKINGRECQRRVGKLYLPPGGQYFGCRQCYPLTYESCQEAHKFDSCLRSLGAKAGLSASEVNRLLKRGEL